MGGGGSSGQRLQIPASGVRRFGIAVEDAI